MELDEEEKETLDGYESGQLELRVPTPEELTAIKAAAEETTHPYPRASTASRTLAWKPSSYS